MDSYTFQDDLKISEEEKYLLYKNNSKNTCFIQYGNRRVEIKLKKLFVDLSKSKIPQEENPLLERRQTTTDSEDSYLTYQGTDFYYLRSRRRPRSFSQDSTVFDFSDSVPSQYYKRDSTDIEDRRLTHHQDSTVFDLVPTQYYLDYNMNTPRQICNNMYSTCRVQSSNCCLKYIYGLALIGSLYIIILVLHQGELIRNLSKSVDNIKMDLEDSADIETRLYRLESSLNNIKVEQESMVKSLKNLLDKELAIYSADKTGRTDYAMEASGGKVVSVTQDTESFDYAKTLFGITLCEGMHGPRAMLQPEMYPGHCWAFKGNKGGAIIKLIGSVRIDAVSLEHIPENVSPTGEITSAPKTFSVAGLRNPTDKGHALGQFTYDIYGSQIQTFEVQNYDYYEYVEFKVISNNDNPVYTCVYRFRVHGTLDKI